MSENTAEKLTEENSESDKEAAISKDLSRFEKMAVVTVWTNRLDRKLYLRLNDLKLWLWQLQDRLASLGKSVSSPSEASAQTNKLSAEANEISRELYPEIVELCVVASDHLYMLDSAAVDLHKKNKELEQQTRDLSWQLDCILHSPSFRIGRFLLAPLRTLRKLYLLIKGNLTAEETQDGSNRSESEKKALSKNQESSGDRSLHFDVREVGSYNPHACVDNQGSAFSIFNNWATVFRHEGRAYGSSKPSVSDYLEHLSDVHRIYSFNNKSVLELGPLEAANTKQMLDLGAENVVAIEANAEAYLKCLVVKNELGLDNAEFIYGDCNEVLQQPRLRETQIFDICLASGILYHMEDPLFTIDLITGCSDLIVVWTQIASDQYPKGEWLELEDTEGRKYTGRRNTYSTEHHWGGIGKGAVWLTEEHMLRAFADRGFSTLQQSTAVNHSGRYMLFNAVRNRS